MKQWSLNARSKGLPARPLREKEKKAVLGQCAHLGKYLITPPF
jgi:hypothetical protein